MLKIKFMDDLNANRNLTPQPPLAKPVKEWFRHKGIISIIVLAVIALVVVWINTNQNNQNATETAQNSIQTAGTIPSSSPSSAVITNQLSYWIASTTGIALSDGSIILAAENKLQNPPPKNPGNLVREYVISLLDAANGKQEQLAVIKNSYFYQPFGFTNNKVFFLAPTGEVASLDLKSAQGSIVRIDGVLPNENGYIGDNTIIDFIVYGDNIFFIRSQCNNEDVAVKGCALGVYNLTSGNAAIIFENLRDKVSLGKFEELRLANYDPLKDTLTLMKIGGDAGWGSAALYEVSLKDSTIKLIDSAGLTNCSNGCTAQEQKDNNRFYSLKREPDIACGKAIISYPDVYKQVKVSIGSKDYYFENSYYAGCWVP